MSDNIKGSDESVSPDVLRSFGFYVSDGDIGTSSPGKKDPRVAMEENMQELFAACQKQVDEAAERQDRDPFPRGTMVMAWGHDCDENDFCDVAIGAVETVDGTRVVLSNATITALQHRLGDVLKMNESETKHLVLLHNLNDYPVVPVIQISAVRCVVVHAPKNLTNAIAKAREFQDINAELIKIKKAA